MARGEMKGEKAHVDVTDQGRAFIEKARELGCDEDPAAFDRMFERIVPPKRKGQDRPTEPKAATPANRPRRS